MRPQVVFFTPEQVERIVAQAIEVLEQVGVFVENGEALTLLGDAGLRIEGQRIYLTEAAIRSALDTAPAGVSLYSRDGQLALDLRDDKVHFDPGSAALHVLDPLTRRRRAPVTTDLVHLAWVTQACHHVQAQSTALVPTDVPQDLADRYRLFIALCHSSKPVVTGTFLKEAFPVMRDLLVAVRGSPEALRERPLAIFDCCPTPPLKWSDLTCQALIDCAQAGIPAQLVSMPMTGATSPVTLRETVVQHCAESLSGVVIHQLVAPGAPIIYGGSPAAFDMRHGTTPMGAIETMMIDMAYAQVGKHLGLPVHAYMALSDAKNADWQAGAESAVGAVLAALAGINLISGPGMLDFESCQSLEKLVLDNEACGMALRLVRGISDTSANEATDLVRAVVEQGHFLGNPHTRKHFREELHIPGRVIDRSTYGDWEKSGSKDSFEAARAEVGRIIAAGNTTPLSEGVEGELSRIMGAEAARHGVPSLPVS